MKLPINIFRKNVRHLFLMAMYFTMLAGISSCGKEELISEPSQPIAADDATLLKWQMEKLINTRAANYNVALVTTNTQFSFDHLRANGSYTVDWGDGTTTVNSLYHAYTDGLQAHTILIYANFADVNNSMVSADNEQIIFADISRAPALNSFFASENRLTNIDVSNNSNLRDLRIANNNLQSIDVSNNSNLSSLMVEYNNLQSIDVSANRQSLEKLLVSGNPMTSIDVTMLPLLKSISIHATQISTLDVSHNPLLNFIGFSNLTSIDLTKNPELKNITIYNSRLATLNLSKNPKLIMTYFDNLEIGTLDFSNNPIIQKITCLNSNVNNMILPNNPIDLETLNLCGCSLEKNYNKITNLALRLPDRTNSYRGAIITSIPDYVSTLNSILQGRNWIVSVRQ